MTRSSVNHRLSINEHLFISLSPVLSLIHFFPSPTRSISRDVLERAIPICGETNRQHSNVLPIRLHMHMETRRGSQTCRFCIRLSIPDWNLVSSAVFSSSEFRKKAFPRLNELAPAAATDHAT